MGRVGGFSFILIITLPAFALVDGHVHLGASPGAEEVIRQSAVRLVIGQGNGVYSGFCSGVNFKPERILTAGHCFDDFDSQTALSNGQVFAEFRDPSNPSGVSRIQVRTAQRKHNADGDLALLTLAKPGPLRQSIPLALKGCDRGTDLLVAGFGVNEITSGARPLKSARYREHNSPHIINETLTRDFDLPTTGDSTTSQWAAERAPQWTLMKAVNGRACVGDSGGPVFCKSNGILSLASIVSRGAGKRPLAPEGETAAQAAKRCQSINYLMGGRLPSLQLVQQWETHPGHDNVYIPPLPPLQRLPPPNEVGR